VARDDHAAIAKRLYERFLAPLVTGGALTPGPAIGARAALALDGGLAAVDPDVRSRVDVARVRVARRLVPVDMLEGPDAHEWALAAALHDMVHALHPGLDRVLHRGAPEKLFDFAEQTLTRVPAAASLKEAVSRHTFFARVFEIERTDTLVSWWSGSKRFLGTEPSPRLLAWPALRRVHTDETTYALHELVETADAAGRDRFGLGMAQLLAQLPLTDLATCARAAPLFAWSGATLGLFGTPHGRVLGLRALALGPTADVDAALGHATLAHVKAAAWEDVTRIADVLGARALAVAANDAKASRTEVTADAHYANVLGAAVAIGQVHTLGAPAKVAQGITARLMPLVQSQRGGEVARLLEMLVSGRSAPLIHL
jgi:hypothetical protein